MKNKVLAILIVLLALVSTAYPVIAGNSAIPVTYTIGAGQTTFTVQTYTGTLNMAFNGSKNQKLINSTGVPSNTAWGNVTNTGDAAQTFQGFVDPYNSPTIELFVNNQTGTTGGIKLTSLLQSLPGGVAVSNVAPNNKFNIYVWANFTNALTGGAATMYISSDYS